MQINCVLEKIYSIQFQRRKFLLHLLFPMFCGFLSWTLTEEEQILLRVFVIFFILRSYLSLIVNEKSNSQKKNQSIMGLRESAYYFGWILATMIHTFICSILYQSLELFGYYINSSLNNLTYESVIQQICEYQLFVFARIGQMLFFSSFFTDGRKAQEFYLILIVFGLENNLPISIYTKSILSILFFPEIQHFRYQSYLISAIEGFIRILLYMYHDQIMPNQQGTQKNPLFFLPNFCKERDQEKVEETLQQQQILVQNLLYQSEQYESEQPMEQAFVKIQNLTKQQLVDRLNLNLYRNSMFCLLGNNEEKSTTLNLICGYIKKDEGNIVVNNLNIDKRLTDVRQIIGYFSQTDVLYPDLSVNDHLKFYGKIKLIKDPIELLVCIQFLVEICELKQESNQLVKYLSDGGKRRLSLAIALMGNSEVLLLDEPTIGLDPINKQQIWSILKKLKSHKCILMTTHLMDEAEELADRVGVMQTGKLVFSGTLDEFKKQFSVGYNISIQCLREEFQIYDQIKQKINDLGQEELQYEGNTIKINIPKKNCQQLESILIFLENIEGINIKFEITSLEDAYKKIQKQMKCIQYIYEGEINNKNMFDSLPRKNIFINQLFGLLLRRFFLLKQNNWQNLLLIIQQIMLTRLANVQVNEFKQFQIQYVLIRYLFVFQLAYSPIYDKQYKIKRFLVNHGMNPLIYWASNFIFDACCEIIILLLWLPFLYGGYENIYIFRNGRSDYIVFYQFLLFSFNLICQTYAATTLQDNLNNSSIQLPILFLLQIPFLALLYYTGIKEKIYVIEVFFFPMLNFLEQVKQLVSLYILSILSCVFYLAITLIVDLKLLPVQQECQIDCIKVSHINQEINNRQVIQDVSFTVQPQQIFGLLGNNGSGKTTLMNILGEVNKAKSGNFQIHNAQTDIGYAPQYFSLWEDLTPKQHLTIYGYIKGLNNDRINKFITEYSKIMRLWVIENKKIQYLSVEEKRKLQLGIALIGGSSKLLLDEPTNGVDSIYRKQFYKLLRMGCRLNDNSVVLTTNSLQEAIKICDQVGIMVDGQLKFNGTIQELRKLFQNRIVITFEMKDSQNEKLLDDIVKQRFQGEIHLILEMRKNKISYLISLQEIELSKVVQFCCSKEMNQLIQGFEIQKAQFDQVLKSYIKQLEMAGNQEPQAREGNDLIEI